MCVACVFHRVQRCSNNLPCSFVRRIHLLVTGLSDVCRNRTNPYYRCEQSESAANPPPSAAHGATRNLISPRVGKCINVTGALRC